ncbi:MAG: ABC transporter permease [Nanoarchaeota archaeon]|nr:ABC transporter permease [Nanoarchaeota archaeon]
MSRTSFAYIVKRELYRLYTTLSQSLFPPIISALLFLTIFSFVLKDKSTIGAPFTEFLVPGLIMMAAINSSFTSTSFSLFLSKWTKQIQLILTTPTSYLELVSAYLVGAILRSLIVSIGIFLVTLFFVVPSIAHVWALAYYFLLACILFGSIGIILALKAETFEHLGVVTTFFLTPLTMLGGVFYSIKDLPLWFQKITLFNPVFYFVDGFRYGLLGATDGPLGIGIAVTFILTATTVASVVYLMKIGWKVKY